ncbi:TfuA-like protein [Ensifer adhaerens]|uniref:TfuA-like protein n=1 Tax=Ensifer adhaerens TaxID=106592 RepID=UPI000DC2891D|nr:TfuA-like protein [Ensifer adhaerens]RAS04370.1 hypothetical protein DEU52_12646 [Ensifer adhaerens]
MKIIFAGPTLYGASLSLPADVQLRPPAKQGDFYKAVREGATVIGLVDGVYEHVPAIWHKEILFGLSEGVRVFGAASMGALRAAECAAFGMVGIGEIYEGYASGSLENDSDVAQSHAPAEMGFLPLSEPVVNVRATLDQIQSLGLVTQTERDLLDAASDAIFFKDRTYKKLAGTAIRHEERSSAVANLLRDNSVNLKLRDAMLLVDAVIDAPDRRTNPDFDWEFAATTFWHSIISATEPPTDPR